MTTYHYSENGDDTILNSANTASIPFRSSNRAMSECTAGDSISFVGTQSAPCRSVLDTTRLPAGATTIDVDGNDGYLLNTVDVSEGATFFADDLQNFCESIGTGTGEWGGSGTQNIAVETGAGNFVSSASSILCYNAAATGIGWINLRWNGKVKIHVTQKNSTAGNLRWRWENDTNNNYFKTLDNTWVNATAATNTSVDADQANFITQTFAKSDGDYIPPDTITSTAGLYKFWIFTNSGEGTYVDQVRFEGVCEWDTAGAEWFLDFPLSVSFNARMMKCASSEWTSSGQSALRNLTKGTVGALNAGEFGIDNAVAVQRLYYKPEAGETISSLHFEATRYLYNTIDQTCNISNIAKVSGGTWGFNLSAGSALLTNVHCDRTQIRGFVSTGASTPKAVGCTVDNIEGDGAANHGEGFFSAGTSVFTIEGADANNIEDECYQPADLSYMILTGSSGKSTGASGNVFEANFTDNQGAQSCGYDIQNCTFAVENSTAGQKCFKQEDDGTTAFTATMKGNILNQNGSVVGGAVMDSANVTLTASNNTFTGSYTGDASTWSGASAAQSLINFGGTEVSVADADLNGDGSLGANSTLIGTGVKWWTGVRPVGANGEPYPDFDLDAGGTQSTYSPHHPANQ